MKTQTTLRTLLGALALALGGVAACGDGGGSAADARPMIDAEEEPDAYVPGACDPTAAGTICTVAGKGESGYSGENGPALEARLSLPQDTLVAPDGTLYVADWNNHRIRAVDLTTGTIRHVAGRGELAGTGKDPTNQDLNHPTGMLLTPDGTTMIIAAWHNSQIRELDLASGELVTTCGDGRRAFFGEGLAALTASLDLPASIAFDLDGNLIIMDQANQVIRRIDYGTGTISRMAGRCVIDSAGACAPGVDPVACPGGSGKTTCGVPATECGKPCTPRYVAGTIADFRMAQPFGQSADPAGRIVFDGVGNLFFADTSNAIIRKIAVTGEVTIVAGTEPVEGAPQEGTSPDGTVATAALLNNPVDLALAADGTLYFTDTYNHCVRKVTVAGMVETVAGVCGTAGFDGDGADPAAAHLKRPYGIELAGDRLFIADTGNHVIRVVNLAE